MAIEMTIEEFEGKPVPHNMQGGDSFCVIDSSTGAVKERWIVDGWELKLVTIIEEAEPYDGELVVDEDSAQALIVTTTGRYLAEVFYEKDCDILSNKAQALAFAKRICEMNKTAKVVEKIRRATGLRADDKNILADIRDILNRWRSE